MHEVECFVKNYYDVCIWSGDYGDFPAAILIGIIAVTILALCLIYLPCIIKAQARYVRPYAEQRKAHQQWTEQLRNDERAAEVAQRAMYRR